MHMAWPTVEVRVAEPSDAPFLAELSRQLGHTPTLAEASARLEAARGDAGRCILVALAGTSVVGWLEVAMRVALSSGSWGEISGLVVDEAWRGRGVGSALVQAARAWAQKKELRLLRVRTRVERVGAASFYERAGFQLRKQQRVFELEP